MYTIISLFSGAGGLDLGFEQNGFKTIWANDMNKDALTTLKLWCKDVKTVQGDIAKIPTLLVPKADGLLGAFPCQGFSLGGNREVDDSRNELYKYNIKMLKHIKPLFYVAENVEGLLTMGNGAVIDKIVSDFNEIGYNTVYYSVNAMNFGIPQDRKRVILLGFRKDLDIEFPTPVEVERVTMRDALWGLPEPDKKDIHWGTYSPRYMTRNRRRGWDEASYTIPATVRSCPLHPSSPEMIQLDREDWQFGSFGVTRRFSWQETAIIQSFPPDMHFMGNLESKYMQIGNAVPPKLAGVFAEELFKLLKEKGLSSNLTMF